MFLFIQLWADSTVYAWEEKTLLRDFFRLSSIKQLQQLATSFVSQSVTHCIVRKLISSAKLLSRDLSV